VVQDLDEKKVFLDLMKKKKRFIIFGILFFLLFYFSLPLSIWMFPGLIADGKRMSAFPWWWVFAFLQFLMTWLLGWLYWKKAKTYDKLVDQLKQGNGQ
jgi:uncharacterized membrane protein (DUF485 family)